MGCCSSGVEHSLGKGEVQSSNLCSSTTKKPKKIKRLAGLSFSTNTADYTGSGHYRGRISSRSVRKHASGAGHWSVSGPGRGRRSEERRVGKECVSKCRSRCQRYH